MKSWILSMSPCLRSWKKSSRWPRSVPSAIKKHIAFEVPQERDQETHRGAESGYPGASGDAGDRDGSVRRGKLRVPYHTHTLHCERALCSFCGYTKHTLFTSYEPKYNSTVRRNLLIRSGQATRKEITQEV